MKKINFVFAAAMISLGGIVACAQSKAPKESSKETTMEDPVMAEADRAAQAAEAAANSADAGKPQQHPKHAELKEGKTYSLAAKIPAMPWAVMQRRITTLIASIHLPEDTSPTRIENILSVTLAQTSYTHWEAEGVFDEGFEYSISVSKSGTEEFGAGYDIYIYLMPSKINDAPVSIAGSTLCTWSMDDFSKMILQNGYEKGLERKLANEVWDFNDLTSNKTYNRYIDSFVYRFKDGSEGGAPCLSRIHISTGYKETQP